MVFTINRLDGMRTDWLYVGSRSSLIGEDLHSRIDSMGEGDYIYISGFRDSIKRDEVYSLLRITQGQRQVQKRIANRIRIANFRKVRLLSLLPNFS